MTNKDRAELTTKTEKLSKGAWAVTIGWTHLPLQYVFRFDERREDDTLALLCNSVTVEVPGGATFTPLLRGLASGFERYEQLARSAVNAQRENGEELAATPVRRQRQLDDEFLREVVQRHEAHRQAGRPPTQALAGEEGVTVGAVKNWLRKAREAGIGEES